MALYVYGLCDAYDIYDVDTDTCDVGCDVVYI